MANFGERIKGLRNKNGLTQRQMAESFGITERNYQRYEASDSPSHDTLMKMADFFDVTTDYLLGRTDCDSKPDADGNATAKTPSDSQGVPSNDAEGLKRKHDDSETDTGRLPFLFDEPLQSYAAWLRQVGISISGGGESGQVVVEIEDDEFFDIEGNVENILNMNKDHFKLLVRQLGKSWPS